ncbi:MAG: aminotransferase class IV, partial [Thermoanaerobaculum sp.]|nr:aminotransferase class IV [Thermoanaerobaculum sp.]
ARLAAALLPPHPLTGHKTVSVGPAQYLHRQALTRGLDGVLFYDRDGTVLETATANVFALLRGELLTPPAPPLALPGVMRAFCLERLRQWGVPVREQPFLLEELPEAEGAFLTSSLAGGVPVREVDGQAIPVGEKLRGLLRQLHLPVPESRAGREA